MTKLLVLSDSHGGRAAIERVLLKENANIDALVFLGDGLRDLEQALTPYPRLRAYSVAGNCDYGALEPMDGLAAFDQTIVFYTHGHMYGVKYDLDTLTDAAAARGAEVAMFGHTHAVCLKHGANVLVATKLVDTRHQCLIMALGLGKGFDAPRLARVGARVHLVVGDEPVGADNALEACLATQLLGEDVVVESVAHILAGLVEGDGVIGHDG